MSNNSHKFDRQYYEACRAAVNFLREAGDKPFLYSYWKRYLRKIKPKGRILDIGCGLGLFLKRMQDSYETYGVDISEYAVGEAKKNAGKSKIIRCSATELPFESNFFDIVAAFDIVEHLTQPPLFFDSVNKVLKKDGIFLLSTVNPYSLGAKVKEKKVSPNLPYNAQKEVWYGTRDTTHVNILPKEKWRELLKENGFSIIRDGTDFLWDVPYFKTIPKKLQWIILISLTWFLVWLNGFYSWEFGENYICIARKT